MTVKEVARQLGISPSLVYGLCAEGKIKHERHGLRRGTIRITLEALQEYRESAEAKLPAVPLRHIRL